MDLPRIFPKVSNLLYIKWQKFLVTFILAIDIRGKIVKMEFFKLTIYLFCSLLGLSKSKDCIVKDQKTNSEKPCVFPFILNDKIYYGCTTDFVETKNLACSTKTNADNEHIRGELKI